MAKYLNSDGLTYLIESFAGIFKAHTHSFVVDAVKKYKLNFEYSRSMPNYDKIAYLPAWVQNTDGTDEDGATLIAIPKTTYINRSEIGDVDDKGTLGWVRGDASVNDIVTRNFLAYWNGAYEGVTSDDDGTVKYNSYLAYCDMGKFGTMATKNAADYYTATEITNKLNAITGGGTTLTGNLTLNLSDGNKIIFDGLTSQTADVAATNHTHNSVITVNEPGKAEGRPAYFNPWGEETTDIQFFAVWNYADQNAAAYLRYISADTLTKCHNHSTLKDYNDGRLLSLAYSEEKCTYDTVDFLAAWIGGNRVVSIPKPDFIESSERATMEDFDKNTINWVNPNVGSPSAETLARNNEIITRNFLAYWNGAYNYGQDTDSGTITYRSYLQYCDKGRFGNGATRNIGSGTSSPTDTIFTQVTGVAPVDGDIYIMISEG